MWFGRVEARCCCENHNCAEMSLSLLSSAPVGFAAPLPAVRPVAQPRPLTMSAADGMEGAAHETGFTTWDPLGLADLGSPATLAFFRHAELKHCRVAMAAFTGWLVASGNQLAIKNGHEPLHFPGYISPFHSYSARHRLHPQQMY